MGIHLFDDHSVVQQVIALHADLRHDPVAARLASIEFGGVDVWSAFQYEIADLLYDDVWRQMSSSPLETARDDRGFIGRVKNACWQGTWGLGEVPKILEATGGLDLLERAEFMWRSRRNKPLSDTEIAIVGFAHRAGVMKVPPFTNDDDAQGPSFRVLLHDDNLGRHRKALRHVRGRLIACESLLGARDYADVTRRASEIAAILNAPETRTSPRAELWHRFHARSVHRRRFRRLALGAEAVRRFLAGRALDTIVIPDERQPLGRAAALMAKASSPARIVSVPEPVDEYVRKMPVWGDSVPDITVLSAQTTRRALTRAGVSDSTFRTRPSPGLESLLSAVAAAPTDAARPNGRRATVLYCDQGLPGTARRFTALAESLGRPPRAALIFRPHPIQSTFLLRRVVRGATVSRSQTIVEAIRSCDIVVTHSSMVATIAANLERPVILWNPDPSPPMPVLLLERIAYWARSRDELSALIRLLLDSGRDHPLRSHQAAFRRELEASRSAEGLGAVFSRHSAERSR